MNNLEIILDFISKFTSTKDMKGTVLLFIFLIIETIIVLFVLLLYKILVIVTQIQKDLANRRLIKLKKKIYYRYAEASRKALNDDKYQLSLDIMSECANVLFNDKKENNKYEEILNDATKSNESNESRIEESISEQSGQSSDRVFNGSKESFVKITD